MTDDPREILQAAGVECAEVEHLLQNPLLFMPQAQSVGEHPTIRDMKAAILALARLVAKQQGMLELTYTDYEARWNPDWGSFRQHDAWFCDLEADNARPDA